MTADRGRSVEGERATFDGGMTMKTPDPILVSHLFRELHGHLLDLLRSLSPEDWHRPTVCSAWCVKDIASHLLDGDLRRLSIQRDGYSPPDAPERLRVARVPGRLPDEAQRRLDGGHPPHQPPHPDPPAGGQRRGGGRPVRVGRPVRPGDLPGRLGGRGRVLDVVRHRQGVHRAVAPPAADRPRRGPGDPDRRPPPVPPGPGRPSCGPCPSPTGTWMPRRARRWASRSRGRPAAIGSSAGLEADGRCSMRCPTARHRGS